MQSVKVHSPGRINLIGEHTDYNNGLVLPAAIDKGVTFVIHRNQTPHSINVTASNMNEKFSFESTTETFNESGWKNYVIGVVKELQKIGCQLEGFDAEFSGDVPIGSGTSSSAALECSLAFGLNTLFDLKLDNWQIIKACQLAEHNYVGTKCGIMDQFASVMGKASQAMLLDCQSLKYEYYPCDLGDYEFLLLNTNVSHSLATSEYNTRREECEEGLHILNNHGKIHSSLRGVTKLFLEANKSRLPEHIYNRCLHVVSEIYRVRVATEALKIQDLPTLGKLMYSSHESLQNQYHVSCAELDFLVDCARENETILGSRMMGGGFGGCTINLIKKDDTNAFIEKTSELYQNKFRLELTPYQVVIGDGAKILS